MTATFTAQIIFRDAGKLVAEKGWKAHLVDGLRARLAQPQDAIITLTFERDPVVDRVYAVATARLKRHYS